MTTQMGAGTGWRRSLMPKRDFEAEMLRMGRRVSSEGRQPGSEPARCESEHAEALIMSDELPTLDQVKDLGISRQAWANAVCDALASGFVDREKADALVKLVGFKLKRRRRSKRDRSGTEVPG